MEGLGLSVLVWKCKLVHSPSLMGFCWLQER